MSFDITCGRCTKDAGRIQKHFSVEGVRECYEAIISKYEAEVQEDEAWEAQAELAAEARNERFWENRGVDDGFDDWEARRGVLSFSDAWDLASPGTRPGYVGV